MKATQSKTTSGIITIYDKEDAHRVLNVPDAGSGQTVHLDLPGFAARKIHMIGIPSAATITLNSKDYVGDKPKWWLELKTTHQPAELAKADIDQYVNRNEKDTFIRAGLGILVIDKSKEPAEMDTLGKITVKVSAASQVPSADALAAALAQGEQP
ncbi:hypothetical protein [Pseudomonas sp. 3HC3]|uniref:hypothetical protein n=1 Tax=Pseudomonas sp. 3HC3 TaxID=2781025 RepID=UPI00383C3C0C